MLMANDVRGAVVLRANYIKGYCSVNSQRYQGIL